MRYNLDQNFTVFSSGAELGESELIGAPEAVTSVCVGKDHGGFGEWRAGEWCCW